MKQRPTHEQRTERAFRTYLDLLGAAEEVKWALRGPLELVDLTVEGFRLLVMLDEEGALPITDVSKRRGVGPEATRDVIARLEKRGWVRRGLVKLPPVEFERAHLPKSRKEEPREGRRIEVVGLTAAGKKFIGDVLTRFTKVFKQIMRNINPREQGWLSRLCRKLREGDVVKFVREIRMEEED